jgi:hypothetical protein
LIELLTWLEGSALGHAIRGSGVWTYGLLNLAHIFGIATLFGAILVLDLRLLGVWRDVPLASLARPTVPVAATGLCLAVASGVCMISTNASEYIGNPFLLIKFPAIALGLINVAVLGRMPAWRERAVRAPTPQERTLLAVMGGISLVCWVIALSAGRMIGYW